MKAKKIIKFFLFPVCCIANFFTATAIALAADIESFSVGKYLIAPGQTNVVKEGVPVVAVYIVRLINFLSLLIGSFAFLAIVIGGIMLVTSGGQEQQLTKGKDVIKYAIIGLAVALASYFITAFVQSIFYEYGPSAPPT